MQVYIRCCAIIATVAIQGSAFEGAVAEEPVSLKDVLSSWKARQTSARTGVFEWTTVTVVPQGSRPPSPSRSGEEFPERDHRLSATSHLIFNDGKVRTGFVRPGYEDIEASERVATLNGEEAKGLMTSRGAEYPIGTIYSNVRHPDASVTLYRPVLYHYRPFDKHTQYVDPRLLRLVDRDSEVDGQRALLLESEPQPNGTIIRLWVAPDKAHSVIRYTRSRAGTLNHQMDVSYRYDKEHGWTPSNWKLINLNRDESLRKQYEASVTRYEINVDVPLHMFHIEFPVGTVVTDRTNGNSWIIQKDGQERAITHEEVMSNLSYEALLNTESGKGHTFAEHSGTTAYLFLLGIGGLVILIVFCATMRFRRE